MIDKEKNVLTTNKAIESLALDVYSDRLKSNKIKEHLESYEDTNNNSVLKD